MANKRYQEQLDQGYEKYKDYLYEEYKDYVYEWSVGDYRYGESPHTFEEWKELPYKCHCGAIPALKEDRERGFYIECPNCGKL